VQPNRELEDRGLSRTRGTTDMAGVAGKGESEEGRAPVRSGGEGDDWRSNRNSFAARRPQSPE
jgi:hypothetical protein